MPRRPPNEASSGAGGSGVETRVAAGGAERLDKFLVAELADSKPPTSRAEVQRWIEAGRVRVDGAVASAPSARLRAGAVVTFDAPPPQATRALPDPGVVFRVVFEDEHLIVIDKPAGLVVHPARGHADGTLVNGLLARDGFAEALGAASPPGDAGVEDVVGLARPGIVHRLDKGTSGLLVVAKDPATREGLKTLFAAHDIDREYIALVVGDAKGGTIATLHGRHPKDRLRFTSLGRLPRGKRAVTHVTVTERFGVASLVACRLETGRTHQLRVHLAERSKTPILGDPLYGSRPHDPWLAELAETLGHQALHARLLGFVHPATGTRLRFESPLPDDVARALAALRERAAHVPGKRRAGATRPSI